MNDRANVEKIGRLLDVGRELTVLLRILDEAREITGARFAAVGVLDEHRHELERFVTAGIDPAAHRAIGDLPRGRGVLGVLIADPRPLPTDACGPAPPKASAFLPRIRRWSASWAYRS